jgi:hypothetical protein
MSSKKTWTRETESALSAAGWHSARCELDMVSKWRANLEQPSGFAMSGVAEVVLAEFGGLRVAAFGSGLQCARGDFAIDPDLAKGEEDRFAAFAPFVEGTLFPIGEAYHGQAFLGIDNSGAVYLVGDSLDRIGEDIYAALNSILEGILPTRVSVRGLW